MKLKIVYRGQLFRLNFQRLISPAFLLQAHCQAHFRECKIIMVVHIEVTDDHESVFAPRFNQVFNALDELGVWEYHQQS